MRRSVFLACASLIGMIAAAPALADQVEGDREITSISAELYRLRDGDRHTVFLATPNGIVLVDPLSLETAQWLKEQLADRFKPDTVRFVLHTSHRFDRAEGASIFSDTAELIGHREFNSVVSRERAQPPRALPAVDNDTGARLLRAKDRNHDGRVTGNEIYARVRDTEGYFDDKRVITIGGRTVEIVRAATPESAAGAIVYFPAERIAFAATAPPISDAPLSFGNTSPHAVQRWLNAAQSVPFDVLILGNGQSIKRPQITKVSGYINDLITRVAAEYERGTGADEFARSKFPAAYRSDPQFRDWRRNVADAYEDVSVFRIDATVGGLANYIKSDQVFCASFTTCSSGGMVPAVTGSLSASFARFAMVAEVTASDQAFSSRTSRFYDEEFAMRETRVAVMARHNVPAGAVSYRFLGGMSYTVAYRDGLDRVKEGLPPFAGRHRIESRDDRWGVTGGLDLVIGHRFGLVIPLRLNYATEDAKPTWPSRMDAQAGVAITLRLFRSVD